VVRRLIDGPVTDDVPASHLRTIHGATLLAGEDAWPAGLPLPASRTS
jgi:hypothetical protein